jgi:hypothetical protein
MATTRGPAEAGVMSNVKPRELCLPEWNRARIFFMDAKLCASPY